jgi:thiamine biosynthesis protein ThiS
LGISGTLRIRVNGDAVDILPGATVVDLLRQLELDPQRVAVERNRSVVPRARHTLEALVDGDELEVVTFVGGG